MDPTQPSSSLEMAVPTSMEQANAQLAEIKLRKRELTNAKKAVNEQMRQLRAEHSNKVGERATAGKGVAGLISKDLGRAAKNVASLRNSYGRAELAKDLEPLEAQRAELEAAIAELDQRKLLIDRWIADQKAAGKAVGASAKPASPGATPRVEQPAASEAQRTVADDRIAKLKDLAALKASGILTEEEFQLEKQRILEVAPRG